MNTLKLLVVCGVVCTTNLSNAQVRLGPNDSFTYEFGHLQLQNYQNADPAGPLDHASVVFVLTANTFQTGEQLFYEAFEESTAEPPIFSAIFDTVPAEFEGFDIDVTGEFPGWGDLQGAMRFTMLSGDATLLSLSFYRFLPRPDDKSDVYALGVNPVVPEPSGISLLLASGATGAICQWRRRYGRKVVT